MIDKKIGIIIQARNGSTRLPNKMTTTFHGNETLLDIVLRRISLIPYIPKVVATSTNPQDDVIISYTKRHNFGYYRGSEENVLNRFIESAKLYNFDKIIRICADNPFIDINALIKMIDRFREIDCDYWCYTLSNGLPTIKTHFGFWGEGVSLEALEKVKSLTNNKSYIEHVTNYIYEHSNYFFVYKEKINKDIEDYKLRLTIDTKDDFELAKEIFDLLNRKGLDCSLENIINLVKTKPDWIHRMKNNIMENLK